MFTSRVRSWFSGSCALLFSFGDIAAFAAPPALKDYFAIHVVDDQTGRGVPLVELSATNNTRYYTDSAGYIAFYEPGLMDTEVFFHVKSHGYENPADGFGYRGVKLRTTPGARAEIKLKRINIAERLYRVTGGGIYRDSVLLGLPTPIERPLLNAEVFGQDSVITALHRGKLYWFWGDTNRPGYPLGNFHAPGATSALLGRGGLAPDVGVNLTYFVEGTGNRERGTGESTTRFAKGTAAIPGDGAVWLDGLVTLSDDKGRERLYAAYARVKSLSETLERGIAVFDDDKQQFEKVVEFPVDAPCAPGGHPLRVIVHDAADVSATTTRGAAGAPPLTRGAADEPATTRPVRGGREYIYFARGPALTRVRADFASFLDLSKYECYTCLKDGSRPADGQIDRDAASGVRYAWRRTTPALTPGDELDLIKADKLKPDEALLSLRDIETGKPVRMHGGSLYWNDYRGRWVLIVTELFGTSVLGEIWYAEADSPEGPWVYGRKIVTHEQYSLYNPKQHPYFDGEGGRVIYFEGTYTTTFSGNPTPTPWYDYNQIMYRLDLGDARLVLPIPVYEMTDVGGAQHLATRGQVRASAELRRLARERYGAAPPIAFFACDRRAPGLVSCCTGQTDAPALFALPPDSDASPQAPMNADAASVVPLYEYASDDGRTAFSAVAPDIARAGFTRRPMPICRVWLNPNAASPRFNLLACLDDEPGR